MTILTAPDIDPHWAAEVFGWTMFALLAVAAVVGAVALYRERRRQEGLATVRQMMAAEQPTSRLVAPWDRPVVGTATVPAPQPQPAAEVVEPEVVPEPVVEPEPVNVDPLTGPIQVDEAPHLYAGADFPADLGFDPGTVGWNRAELRRRIAEHEETSK